MSARLAYNRSIQIAYNRGVNMKKALGWILIIVCMLFSLQGFAACKKTQNGHTRYEIIAEYSPENRTLAGAVKVTFENPTNNELSVLKFQLYPNAYRKNALYSPVSTAYANSAYYNGESYGEMVISSVNGAKNWEVMGDDENILYVFLERSLYPQEKVVLDIGFMTKLAEVNHRTGVTKKTVNLGNFFPILCGIKHDGFYETAYYSVGDPFYQDCADYKMTLTLPKEYSVAGTGKIVGERTLETKKVYTMYATNTRDFALVLSKYYRAAKARVDDVDILYYYYSDKTPQVSLAVAKESFEYFEKTFGEYPYETYTVAQTGFCLGGMEYPAFVMISDSLKETERARVIAHETAHQWWYAAVGSNQVENAWQDEGLAEYSTVMFFENYEKYEYTREELVTEALKEYRSYYDVYGNVLGRTDTRMTRHLSEYVGDYEYKCLAYDKGVLMFDTLRKSVGDKKFTAGLKKYYTQNRFKIATVGDLIGSFEKVGLDVHGFFDSFLSGKAIL